MITLIFYIASLNIDHKPVKSTYEICRELEQRLPGLDLKKGVIHYKEINKIKK